MESKIGTFFAKTHEHNHTNTTQFGGIFVGELNRNGKQLLFKKLSYYSIRYTIHIAFF